MLDSDRTEFKVGSGFSDNDREWQNAPSIGSTTYYFTYRYFELTDDEKPGQPVFVRVRPHEKILKNSTQSKGISFTN